MLVGRLYQVAQNESKEKHKNFLKRNAWKEKRLNDEINTLKGTRKVALGCTANKVTEIDSEIISLEEKLHKI